MKEIQWMDVDLLIANRFVELALLSLSEDEYRQRFQELHWLKRKVWELAQKPSRDAA